MSVLLANETERLSRFLNEGLSEERKDNLNGVIDEIVKHWQQNNSDGTAYDEDMQTRIDYLNQAMVKDMQAILKEQYPKTSAIYQQVNFGLIAYIYGELAMVFSPSTKFGLVDTTTEEAITKDTEDEQLQDYAAVFDKMVEKSNMLPTLIDVDAQTQLCQRSCAKPFWDDRKKKVVVASFGPQKVKIYPNVWREWDPDAALAVFFERPGVKGLSDEQKRYEVFSASAQDLDDANYEIDSNGAPIIEPKLHYVTDGENDWTFNDDGKNPYIDPNTGRYIVPYVWFAADAELVLYPIGKENALTINRRINQGMTIVMGAESWLAIPFPQYNVDDEHSDAQIPSQRLMSPTEIVKLPKGVTLEFINSNLKLDELKSLYQDLSAWNSKLNHLSANVLTSGNTEAEQSGRALKIKNATRDRQIKKLIPIYKPYVEQLLYIMCIVHNTHNTEPGMQIDLTRVKPVWYPGDIEYPVDQQEVFDLAMAEVNANVTTFAHHLSEIDGISLSEAQERILANKEANDALKDKAQFGGVLTPDQAAEEVFAEEETEEEAEE